MLCSRGEVRRTFLRCPETLTRRVVAGRRRTPPTVQRVAGPKANGSVTLELVSGQYALHARPTGNQPAQAGAP
jgi:hypothetical protein